eukprot:scaffold2438_cov257-Pinguiococcus_pyrenoidosus.AAC.9
MKAPWFGKEKHIRSAVFAFQAPRLPLSALLARRCLFIAVVILQACMRVLRGDDILHADHKPLHRKGRKDESVTRLRRSASLGLPAPGWDPAMWRVPVPVLIVHKLHAGLLRAAPQGLGDEAPVERGGVREDRQHLVAPLQPVQPLGQAHDALGRRLEGLLVVLVLQDVAIVLDVVLEHRGHDPLVGALLRSNLVSAAQRHAGPAASAARGARALGRLSVRRHPVRLQVGQEHVQHVLLGHLVLGQVLGDHAGGVRVRRVLAQRQLVVHRVALQRRATQQLQIDCQRAWQRRLRGVAHGAVRAAPLLEVE